MNRSILAALATSIAVALLSGTGCGSTGVGDPCIPEQEYLPSFTGFSPDEVSTESKSFQCQTRLCLVNHFQGRVTCPYGQPAASVGYSTASACAIPGTKQPVTGGVDAKGKPLDKVLGQCADRTADKAVYCSCRCADVNGQTSDGSNYCKCPDGYQCEQLVTSVNASHAELTGGYCIKTGTKYDPTVSCLSGNCDPAAANCGTDQLPPK